MDIMTRTQNIELLHNIIILLLAILLNVNVVFVIVIGRYYAQIAYMSGCGRSRLVTFTAIRLRGPGFKPRPGQTFENGKNMLQTHPSGGEGVSPVQGEA